MQNGKLGVREPQSTSEFDQNASEKNSEVFISEFSLLGMVQNGKLGVEKPRKNILRVSRELPVLDLTVDLGFLASRNDLHGNPRFKTCAEGI